MTDDAKTSQPPKRTTPQEERAQLAERRGLEFRNYLIGRADLVQRMVRPKSQLSALLLVRAAELTFRRDPRNLLEPKTWPTVLVALMTAAQLDLEPGGPLADAHLVPWFDKDLGHHVWSLMPGYRGLCKLAIQSGLVRRLRAFAVYARDPFEIEQGSEPKVTHKVHTGADRGEIIGAYAVARMVDEEVESEWMPWAEIDRIKVVQQGRSPAWREWPDQMARKLPLKRLCNQLPLGHQLRLALEVDHAASDGDTNALRRVVRDAEIDPDGIIDVVEAPAALALAPSKAASMADRIAQRGTAKEPVPVAAKKAAEKAAVPTTDPWNEPDACQSCGVPVDDGVKLCSACEV
jgi:recombination protein RecT